MDIGISFNSIYLYKFTLHNNNIVDLKNCMNLSYIEISFFPFIL